MSLINNKFLSLTNPVAIAGAGKDIAARAAGGEKT